jgi:cell division protein FtsQ
VYVQTMDRSRRQGAKESATIPPPSSRLTFKGKGNRKKTGPIWTRMPKPAAMADACGRALRRSLPAVIGAGVLVAIGGSAWAGYRFVTSSPRFAITDIEVRGNHHLSTEHVLAGLPAHRGDNVFTADLNAIVEALRADPWIASAHVYRMLPHTLAIEVVEHEPAAIADLGGPYLVDRDGHVFKRLATDSATDLPRVTGIDRSTYVADPAAVAAQIHAALTALTSWRAGADDRPSISELHLDARGALALRTAEPATEIELGAMDDGLAARMHTFDAVWASLDDAERASARAVHLDSRSDHVTIAFR